ncbi:cyclic nucleotide-binding domain-containing protein, partial [bacterium]|nr:cyclic nucleotide-binding domain-containing protein [bacterium]
QFSKYTLTTFCSVRVAEVFTDIEIPVEEIAFFDGHVSQVLLEKDDYFCARSEICKQIAFIDSGRLQSRLELGGGKPEISLHFKHQFVSNFSSFFNQAYSHCAIRALETSHLTVISYSLFQHLTQRHVCWVHFWLRVMGTKLADLEERERRLKSIQHRS